MPEVRALLRGVQAVAFGWHGVLFDRSRAAVHGTTRATLARWGVEASEAELLATRGSLGRMQLQKLFAMPAIAERFRAHQHRWLSPEVLDAMTRDLEERLVDAAHAAREPNPDACAALERLHGRGRRTAVICCTSRRLLAPQLESIERLKIPLDCVITADEACDPAPAPWGIYEAVQRLRLADPSLLVLVDDSPDGATAAKNAGASAIALEVPGAAPAPDARFTIRSLDDLGVDPAASEAPPGAKPTR